MNYGEGRVWRRGTIWHIAWHEDGAEFRESTHQTDELVARARLREKLEAAATGRRTLSSKELTVDTLCREMIARFKRKKQNVKEAEYNARVWRAAVGGSTSLYKVADRVKGLIRDWQDAEEDEDGNILDEPYADATINRRLAFLQAGARELKFTPLWTVAKDFKLREDNVRDAYMNPVEFGRLYAAASQAHQALADYLEWLYLTGMRRGEASLLEARWVDTYRWVLTIPGRVQKHRQPRVVPLEGPMRRLAQARLAAISPQTPWLFHRDGAPFREIRQHWLPLLVEAGLAERDGEEWMARFRPHDLRRSATTNLVRHMSIKEAMRITGHLTISTFNRYLQTPDDQLRERLQTIPEPPWAA